MGVGETAATGLALVIHELATNAVKYGSLSVPEGTLDVSGTLVENAVEVTWIERGGPYVVKPEGAGGYGSELLRRTLTGALGGSIEYQWPAEGLLATLRIDESRLAAS
jgi:two-component sensor histidine kinase